MDLNEIGLSSASPDLTLDMFCPKVGGMGKQSTYNSSANNWSREQCILRVRLNNPCTINCPHGKEILAELEASGEDWQLDPFPGVAVGKKPKGRFKQPPNPNDKWPGIKKERNVKLTRDIITGMPVFTAAEKYGVSPTNIRRVFNTYFEIANPKVFRACPANISRIEYARVNKVLVLPYLVYCEDCPQILKGA